MDELVKIVCQKTGLPEDQAKAAAQAVIEFLKEKLPAPISSQVESVLASPAAGDVAKRIGGLFG